MTGTVGVEVTAAADGIRQLPVDSAGGSVAISSAQQSDVAAALQLGVANGGIEITRWSRARPAPNGIVGRLNNGADDLGRLHTFANIAGRYYRRLAADRSRGRDDSHALSRAPVCRASGATDVCRNQLCSGGGRQHARLLPQCASAPRRDRCFHLEQYKTARLDEQPLLGQRAGLTACGCAALRGIGCRRRFAAQQRRCRRISAPEESCSIPPRRGPTTFAPTRSAVPAGSSARRVSGKLGGRARMATPRAAKTIRRLSRRSDRDVDLFNLMILPRANGQSDSDRENLWGTGEHLLRHAARFPAGRSAQHLGNGERRRQRDRRLARRPRVKDHRRRLLAAPGRVRRRHDASHRPGRLDRGTDGPHRRQPRRLEGAGRARGDHPRHSWRRARACPTPRTASSTRKAVNAIRVFPTGIVSLGRAHAGRLRQLRQYPTTNTCRSAGSRCSSRRAFYRGLQFAVFEPNDEPLWAQIRLAAGAFMNNLFRQGAFQGQKAARGLLREVRPRNDDPERHQPRHRQRRRRIRAAQARRVRRHHASSRSPARFRPERIGRGQTWRNSRSTRNRIDPYKNFKFRV